MTWKCKNEKCLKTFEVLARITTREQTQDYASTKTEKIVEKACCPYCLSIDFEEVKETT